MDKKISDIIRNILLLAITAIGSLGLYIFNGFDSDLKTIADSVTKLNISIAKILEREQMQEKTNDFFHDRIKILESKTKSRWTKIDHDKYSNLIDKRFDTLIQTYEKRFESIEQQLRKKQE